ncbi:MAG: diguanylate cyclase, partial [Actinomycetota bacterium]|nr:diguanylate cyclase [Actinomycetota bacterium]
MLWQNTNFLIPLLSIILISIPGTFYIWTYRKGLQDIIGIGIMILSTIWLTAYIFQQCITINYLKVLFDKIQYTGILLLPVGLFLLAVRYVNYNKIFKIKYILLICTLPVITVFLTLTNEIHKLIWTDAKVVLFDSFNMIVKEYNTMYFVSIFYSLALTIAGIVIIVIDIIKSYGNPGEQNNWKKFLLIPYILIPWLVTLIKYQSFNPFPFIVETPIIITACTPIIIGFLNKTKIREIMPVTFETIFEKMDDGIILVDKKDNILKLNQASRQIFNIHLNEVVGKPIINLLTRLNESPDAFLKNEDLKIKNKGGQYFYNARQTEIKNDRGKLLGKVIVLRDITEIRKAEEEIKYLSFYDKLTGVYNRAFFDIELNRLNASHQMPLSLVIGDVNGLKIINDAFGHAYGDKLLIKIADILKSCFRKEDIIARWGGDEFSALLPNTSYFTTMQIVNRVIKKCKECSTDTMVISISIGVATKEKVRGD